MNLLNNLFSEDNEIRFLNKKYLVFTIIICLLIVVSLFIKKDFDYQNSYNVINGKMVLLVEKDYVNKVKETKKIKIDEIICDYSINEITSLDNTYLINVSLKTPINNINSGLYKINLGKERLFDYIRRIIRK